MPTLWLPGRLPGLNELLDGKAQHGQWNAYNARKQSWSASIKLVAQAKGLPVQSPCYISLLALEPNRKRDPDNLLGGAFKIALDALTAAGVLAGDGWSEVLGLAGFWEHMPHRVGTLLYFSPSGLVTKDTMLLLLAEEIGKIDGNQGNKDRSGSRAARDAGRSANAAQASAGKP